MKHQAIYKQILYLEIPWDSVWMPSCIKPFTDLSSLMLSAACANNRVTWTNPIHTTIATTFMFAEYHKYHDTSIPQFSEMVQYLQEITDLEFITHQNWFVLLFLYFFSEICLNVRHSDLWNMISNSCILYILRSKNWFCIVSSTV